MPLSKRLAGLAFRAHLPRRTVRLRLTAMYGALFLLSGAGVLAITYLLVHESPGEAFFINRSGGGPAVQVFPTKVGPFGGSGVTIKGSASRTGPAPPLASLRTLAPAQAAKAPRVQETRILVTPHGESRISRTQAVKTSHGGQTRILATPKAESGNSSAQAENVPTVKQAEAQARQLRAQATSQRSDELHQLLVKSGIALGIMAVVSIALGWLISGRVLRPLRTMTAATRRISEDNLHERLALQGPDDELKDLADTIDGLLARLEAAFDAQRRFVANASHELRTPLAMMRTSLDVAVAKPEPLPPQVGVLEGKLREGLDQADRLLESFLALARAQHGALVEQASVSLAQIAAEVIRTHSEAIAAKGIAVRESLHDAQVTGSETLLARMIENVIDNAIGHNEPGGWMSVQTGVDGERVRVVVESSGPLLEQSKVSELAQPFRRLAAERTGSENGVGLGLSIVAAIAGAHGGTLELTARPEGGLCVQLLLPLAPRAVALAVPA
jgi:hypothetical protein